MAIEIAGYRKASITKKRRLIVSVTGPWKSGKTHLSLTAPAPIALIDMDTGLEGVVEDWAKKKEILISSFDYHDASNQDEHLRLWEDCKQAYLKPLKHPKVRTVVWDTATEGYELIRMARFGKLNKVAMQGGVAVPYPYGPVNAEYRDLLRKALDSDKNVLLLHRTKDEYVNDKRTGRLVRAGLADMEFVVQVNLRTWYDEERGGFGFTVLDCRQNRDVIGLELVEPLNTFSFLATQVFTDTSEEEWE
jgi:hypothetical protein